MHRPSGLHFTCSESRSVVEELTHRTPAPQVSSDMEKLTKEGINSFKFFLAYKGAMAVTDEQLLKGLRRSKELGALPMVRRLACTHTGLQISAKIQSGQVPKSYIADEHMIRDECTAGSETADVRGHADVPIQANTGAVADCLKGECRMQIHCENTEGLVDAQERTFSQGFTGPEGHYISRPATLEVSSQPSPLMPEPSVHRSAIGVTGSKLQGRDLGAQWMSPSAGGLEPVSLSGC